MLFCSQQFLLFFLAVFVLYWAVPRHAFRIYLLLVASFIFYATWNEWLAVLIVISTTADYLIARAMDACARRRVRQALLSFSILGNVGILCYFKYANFFLRSLEDGLKMAGANSSLPVLSVILPIGISFYTFEAISYSVDVYRRKIRPEKNLAHFMLFILFFPHLIAGPIVRGSDFLPQIRRKKRWNWLRLNAGLQLFLQGMFKKLVIADRMAMLTDPVFANPEAFRTDILWAAALAYAIQVFCDFSGYTDMARGTAHLLGYRLAINFNMPFLARNIAEFWRRWHISLSSWLRDYVFIPLGGSRRSRWFTCCNLLIVMTLGGLWHGAAWPFVVFGVIQGVWLGLHRLFREWAERRPQLSALLQTQAGTALCVAGTFVTFCCTLVVFRAPTLSAGRAMLAGMFRHANGLREPINLFSIAVLAGAVALGHWLGATGRARRWLDAIPATARGAAYGFCMSVALLLTPDSGKSFIYFQF
jgi:alginate O-acetyltransferase complex protein AlgI